MRPRPPRRPPQLPRRDKPAGPASAPGLVQTPRPGTERPAEASQPGPLLPNVPGAPPPFTPVALARVPRNPRLAIIGLRAKDRPEVPSEAVLNHLLGLHLSQHTPMHLSPTPTLPSPPTGLRAWLVASTYGQVDMRRAIWFGWHDTDWTVAQLGAQGSTVHRGDLHEAAIAKMQKAGYPVQAGTVILVLTNFVGDAGAWDTTLIGRAVTHTGQQGWRYCAGCNGLVFEREGGSGRCPAGTGTQPHTLPPWSFHYMPRQVAPSESAVRWCSACEQLWHKDGDDRGACPQGGAHTEAPAGGAYTLPNYSFVRQVESYQAQWGVCGACRAIVYFDSKTEAGRCPAASRRSQGTHIALPGLDLMVPFEQISPLNYWAHELGHTLYLQHMYSTNLNRNNDADSCAGAYEDWGDVMGVGGWPDPNHGTIGMPYAAAGAWVQGWLPPERVVVRTWSPGETLEVTLCDPQSDQDHPHLLVVQAPDATYGVELEGGPGGIPVSAEQSFQVRRYHGRFASARAGFVPCDRCGGLVDAHDRACGRGSAHITPDLATHKVGFGSGAEAPWRWCKRCSMLWRPGVGAQGCPAGGEHSQEGSGAYALTPDTRGGELLQCTGCGAVVDHNGPNHHACTHGDHTHGAGGLHAASGSAQPGWRTCSSCAGVVFTGDLSCAGGGAHLLSDPGGKPLSYALEPGRPGYGAVTAQTCVACRSVFTRPGVCAGGGTHTPHPDQPAYTLPAWIPRDAFYMCKRCEVYIRADLFGTPCLTAGTHEAAPGTFYFKRVDPHPTTGVVMPPLAEPHRRQLMLCTRCGGLVDPTLSGTRCIQGGSHTFAQEEYLLAHNRWEHPFYPSFACSACGLVYYAYQSTGASAPRHCAGGTAGHTDAYGGKGYLFGWILAGLGSKQRPWCECTRCGLLVLKDHAGSACAAGESHTLDTQEYGLWERDYEWGLIRLPTRAVSTWITAVEDHTDHPQGEIRFECTRVGRNGIVKVR